MQTERDIWAYQSNVRMTGDITGFGVEAADGSIGKIDEANDEAGARHIVVDTGPWIFGKKVLLPAGVVQDIDYDEEKVYVDRTKEEIKNAPEFNEATYRGEAYRRRVGSYYGSRERAGRN